jgi:DNA polymerase elongation subunit (family B)/intein/homing endonuclease
MKVEFCITAADYVMEGGGRDEKPAVRLWGRTRQGRSVLVTDRTFKPYFYVEFSGSAAELRSNIMRLEVEGEHPAWADVVEKNILGRKSNLMQVVVRRPASVPKFRELLKGWKDVAEEYEYGIPFHKRYLIDRRLRPMGWAEAEGNPEKNRADVDFAIDADSVRPLPGETAPAGLFRVASLFVENGNGKLESVSIAANCGAGKTIRGGEREIVRKFASEIRRLNPDFIVGYGSDRRGLNVLSAKAAANRARLGIGRDGSHVFMSKRGLYAAAEVAGRPHIDLYNFIANILSPNMSADVLSLENSAAELAGRTDAKGAKLVMKLAEHLLPQIFEIAHLVGQDPFDASRMAYSQLVEALLMREAFESGEVILNRPKSDEIAKRRRVPPYEGGYVHQPRQGIHDNIALFDFASLYPSITITHNISPESIPPQETVLASVDGRIKMAPVGEIVDALMEKHKGSIIRRGNSDVLRNIRGMGVFSFDSSLRVKEAVPTAIIRNNGRRRIYQIKMGGGRSVNTTGDHNVFSLRNGEVECARTCELRKGDFIAVPRRIRTNIRRSLSIFDLLMGCDRDKLSPYYLHLDELPLLLRNRRTQLTSWLGENGYSRMLSSAKNGWLGHFKSLPMAAVKDLNLKIPPRLLRKSRIVVGGSRLRSTFPAILELSYDLGFVLGALISEDVLSRKTVFFTNNDADFHRKFSECFRKAFGIRLKRPVPNKSDRCMSTFSGGRGVSGILELAGVRLERTIGKEIPYFLFDSPEKCVSGFLEAYIRGDGHVDDENIEISTASGKIPSGLSLLLCRVGVMSSIARGKRGDFSISVTGESYERLAGIVGKKIRRKWCKDVIPVRDMLMGMRASFTKEHFSDPDLLRSIMYNIKNKGRNPTRMFIRHILPHTSATTRRKLEILLSSDLGWTQVKSVEPTGYADRTYDFEVDGSENFIGGQGFVCLHNTLDCDCCRDVEKARVPELNHYFCTRRPGFIPRVLQNLVLRRSEIKAQMKRLGQSGQKYRQLQGRQYAMKIIANASYGYYGYAGSRWYSRIAAECITAWGRHYIKKVISLAESMGFEVIYGDTDSLFVKVTGKEDAMKFLQAANAALPGVMEMDLQGIYTSGIFVPAKTGAAAKKRYALLTRDGKLVIRGFEKVRRDWSEIAKGTQEAVLRHVLKDKSPAKAADAVRKSVSRLKSGRAPMAELIIRTSLTKPLSEYEQVGPHVAAARKLEASGKDVGEGDIIEYVITKGENTISERAEPAESAKSYDPDYYISNQVIPAALRVLSVFGYTEDDLLNRKHPSQPSLASFAGAGRRK